MEYSIVVEGLSHSFGNRMALQDLSFEVKQGEVFTMLGPNGAGKTTTIRLLNGLYRHTSGAVCVLGLDPVRQGQEVRAQCGVLTETNALYERLTARENLLFFGRLYGMPESVLLKRTQEILSFFGLEARQDDRVSAFSKGMKQRLALARALLHKPRILFLDEPTSSLDPESTEQVHDLITSIRSQGDHTVFLCTHHLEEAQKLSDRLAILNSGKLLGLGSLVELDARFNPGVWVNITLHAFTGEALEIEKLKEVLKVETNGKELHVQVRQESDIPEIITALVRKNAQILSVSPQRASLEEIYFKLQAGAQ